VIRDPGPRIAAIEKLIAFAHAGHTVKAVKNRVANCAECYNISGELNCCRNVDEQVKVLTDHLEACRAIQKRYQAQEQGRMLNKKR
jgi:hypothetical protein